MSKILSVYRRALSNVLSFFLLGFFCVIASFLAVCPFYYLATSHKGIYTALCLSLIFLLFSTLFARKVFHLYRESRSRLISFFIKLSIPIIAISLFLFFAISLYRIMAIVTLVFFFLLYIILVPLLNMWAKDLRKR